MWTGVMDVEPEIENALVRTVTLLIMVVALLLSHWMNCSKYRYATEGSLSLLLGLIVGGAYYFYTDIMGGSSKLIDFNEDLFFEVMLEVVVVIVMVAM
jgi:hypothetical protein